jgi:hypothetical protein
MMIPGCAPSTPASQESSIFTKRPCFSSRVSSPMYQTFPAVSWAYQSKVRSIGLPCEETVSRTTVDGTPRIIFVWWVTTMSSVCGVFPSSATPL